MEAKHIPSVVVTGGSAGLGRAVAIAFANEGYDVAVIARESGRLADVQREIENCGRRSLAFSADVADAAAVERAADEVVRQRGAINVWVNCAMATVFAPFHQITPDEFRRATEVTYLGYVYGTMAALKHMRRQNSGTIVQVGSALAYRAIPLQSAYCGAKFAIRGFTDALRSELQHDGGGVRVTMVQMPALNTPQFEWALNKLPKRAKPVPPVFQPEAGARAVVRAAKDAPRELWVGFSVVKAILGNMIAPGAIDRYLARTGYRAQESSEPADSQNLGNLFQPVVGQFGSHGRFDGIAKGKSIAATPTAIKSIIGLGLLVCLAVILFIA
jgi:short-subunit dehydrogenase